ncbi:MAG: acyltransferase domain-containing protein, partial [Acidobacteria bacterium]
MSENLRETSNSRPATAKTERLIAIIGMGGVLPGARNVPEFWQNVREGKDCVVEVPKERWDPAIFYDPDPETQDKCYGKNAGFILDLPFDTREFRIPPRTRAVMDRSQKLLLTAALEAMRDSGYYQKPFDRDRTAVVIGNAGGRTENETAAAWTIQLPLFEEAIKEKLLHGGHASTDVQKVVEEFRSRMLAGLPELTEDTLAGDLRNVAVGRVASHFDLHGPSYIVDAACASGLAALDFAADGLSAHEYDLALSGAFYASLEPLFFVCFSKFRGLSPDRIKPFDQRADGFVGGEGACVFVLKRLADAVRDRDRIYAVLRGIGSSSDGREKGIGAPNPAAQALAMRRAFDQAGYDPETVQLVETHGAGTQLGDVSEFEATHRVFGSRSGERGLWLTAVKSQLGHLMGAAGAAGAMKTVSALYHKLLPPTINHVQPRKELPWQETGFRVVTKSELWPENIQGLPRRANVSSFGFGGNNYHAAFEEYVPSFHGRLINESGRESIYINGRAGATAPGGPAVAENEEDEVQREPIAVIGLGAALPGATGVEAVWETILGGRNAIRQVPDGRWNGKSRFYAPESRTPGPKVTSLLGGFIDHPPFDSRRFRIPPGTARGMDPQQKLFMQTALGALTDAGYADGRSFDRQRTAVVLGGAAGCQDTLWAGLFRPNALRARFHLRQCETVKSLGLNGEGLEKLLEEVERDLVWYPPVTEDSVLAICVQIAAARFAKALDLMGTHCNIDAACASSLASIVLAVRGLQSRKWDMVVVGGVSEGITPLTLVTFSLAGVISDKGSRPFDTSADGFIPAEGSVVFVLKRLSEAVKDGDRIYAVIRGVGASSDGKGRSMMAPRPEGQAISLRRAYEDAGYGSETVDLVECHATGTSVGDPAEVEALRQVFGNGKGHEIAIGSAKSQFGHLIGAAGSAGLLKAVLALHHKVLPPTINVSQVNPALRLQDSPFYLVDKPREWPRTSSRFPRRAGVSSFGFGGTNWHITLEEFDRDYHERLLARHASRAATVNAPITDIPANGEIPPKSDLPSPPPPAPPGQQPAIFAFGAPSVDQLRNKIDAFVSDLGTQNPQPGRLPCPEQPPAGSAVRLAIVAADGTELRDKIGLIYPRLSQPRTPAILEAQGIFLGRSPAGEPEGKICFLFPGQGPQYPDMWRQLADSHPEVRATFEEANETLSPLLNGRLEDLIFTRNGNDAEVEKALLNSELVQPVLLTANIAMYRLLRSRGLNPDIVAGHSLGEYSALVAAGVLDLASALKAVHVRGREFRDMSEGQHDPGLMAMVTAPVAEVEAALRGVHGYAVIANSNCTIQTVISGASTAVREAVSVFERRGIECRVLPIAGAFHSAVARAIVPAMTAVLSSLEYHPPTIPVLSSVTGEYYRAEGIRRQAMDNLIAQLSGPVDFVGLVNHLYADGARTYLEVGPKKALCGFVDDILSGRPHRALFSNHPKVGEIQQVNRLLAQLFALGYPIDLPPSADSSPRRSAPAAPPISQDIVEMKRPSNGNSHTDNGKQKIVITGASVGLPGQMYRVFSDDGIFRLMAGQSLIDPLGSPTQDRVVDKNVMRVVKPENGESYFEKVCDRTGSIKLAGRRGKFQLEEFGLGQDWLKEADLTDQMAVAVGLEALRDAGIPLQKALRKTTNGLSIPNGWLLPERLQAETAVIFGSIYAGLEKLLDEVSAYYRATLGPLAAEGLRAAYRNRLESAKTTQEKLAADQWFSEEVQRLKLTAANGPYEYSNSLLKAINCKGNALLAQLIGARGPNLHMDSACASHMVALGLAEDMIRTGRARRVIVVGVDNITSDHLIEWLGTGFLALGAAATDDDVCRAALPFDRRRHGLLLGMGASAVIVETDDDARERGIEPIAELLGVHVSNSASHQTRLDVDHVAGEMERFIARMEPLHGLSRHQLAERTLYMSHETYTPARGGSAQAEVQGLKAAFRDSWQKVLIANTKGMTGHCQAAGIEDVVAVKALQFGQVPPIANFVEQDPEFEGLNLSRGGHEQKDYAFGFAAGFGSHVSMYLARAMCRGSKRISDEAQNRRWLSEVTGLENPQTLVSHRTLRVQDGNATAPAVKAPEREVEVKRAAETPVAPVRVAASAPVAAPRQNQALEDIVAGLSTVRQPDSGESGPDRSPAPTVDHSARPRQIDVQEMVLTLFEEKTGYERELLELDLDLEADLGIDTIKQAQIFASIRDKYGLEREEGVQLKDFPTLRHIIGYISKRVAENPGMLGELRPPTTPPAPKQDQASGDILPGLSRVRQP